MKNNILVRGIKAIEVLASLGPLSVERIYSETQISRSSIYRILCILEELNYVSRYRNNAEDIWTLDLKLLRISSSILSRLDLRDICRDIVYKLAEETNEIVQLGILHNNRVLFLDVVKRPKSLVNVAGVGEEIDINISAAGMAIAAFKDEKEQEELFKNTKFQKYTDRTLTSEKDLKEEFLKIRKRGYSMDDQNYAIGHRCIGAPIFDYTKKVAAGINISGHISTISDSRLEQIIGMVKQSAKEASERLGFFDN